MLAIGMEQDILSVDPTLAEGDLNAPLNQTAQQVNPQGVPDDVSEDEKDAAYIQSYMVKKRVQNRKKKDSILTTRDHNSQGQEIYESMIKRTLSQIREINDREEKLHLAPENSSPTKQLIKDSKKLELAKRENEKLKKNQDLKKKVKGGDTSNKRKMQIDAGEDTSIKQRSKKNSRKSATDDET
jgi:hypothetical protein